MLGRSRGLFLFRPLATLQFQSPGPALSPPPLGRQNPARLTQLFSNFKLWAGWVVAV